MFPSTHDITPSNLIECMIVIGKLLAAGNQLLLVTKPHLSCIKALCENLIEYREQLTFRFTIGSIRDDVLRFWEPGAPGYTERLSSLIYAFESGYRTSVSCEPFLDPGPFYVYEAVAPYITDSFWLGMLRKFKQRVYLDGISEEEKLFFVETLKVCQTEPVIRAYYQLLKDKPYVRFKDSIREILKLTP